MKFRVYDKDKNEYVKDEFFINNRGALFVADPPTINGPVNTERYLVEYSSDRKDIAGKNIHDGDRLQFDIKDPEYDYYVKYENDAFYIYHSLNFRWGLLSRAFDPDFKDINVEIVGNIHGESNEAQFR